MRSAVLPLQTSPLRPPCLMTEMGATLYKTQSQHTIVDLNFHLHGCRSRSPVWKTELYSAFISVTTQYIKLHLPGSAKNTAI